MWIEDIIGNAYNLDYCYAVKKRFIKGSKPCFHVYALLRSGSVSFERKRAAGNTDAEMVMLLSTESEEEADLLFNDVKKSLGIK